MAAQRGDVSTLERGSIYFFYRPWVGVGKPKDINDIDEMYLLLAPEGKQEFRLGVIGHKHLPDPSKKGHQRFWGFIDDVAKSPEDMAHKLKSPDTGENPPPQGRIPPARPAGEGVYRIMRHEDHTHLVYALELPRTPGEAQELLDIEDQASYILTIKNPEKRGPSPVSFGKEEAHYPENLQKGFQGEDFGPADPPAYLDYEGTQFVLISASPDVTRDLGITLHPQQEEKHSLEVFRELDLERNTKRVEPLFKGELV